MSDTGAPWNIPYVEPTDLVRSYPAADEAQALAVAAGLSAAGGLVEVKSVLKTDIFSVSLAGGADALITDLTISHAVADAANKVLVYVNCGMTAGANFQQHGIALAFDGTLVQVATATGSRQALGSAFWTNANSVGSGGFSIGFHYVVSPGDTSSHTYAAHLQNGRSDTRTYFVNRATVDTDAGDNARASSSIIIMEIKV